MQRCETGDSIGLYSVPKCTRNLLMIKNNLNLLRFYMQNKTPPARNCKRRTARGITCPSVTCLGVPHPDLAGGYPIPGSGVPYPWPGVPHPDLGHTPCPFWGGTPSPSHNTSTGPMFFLGAPQ